MREAPSASPSSRSSCRVAEAATGVRRRRSPGVPLLSNLVANFQGPCNGGTGTTLSFSVDYRDSDGDIRGGTLQTTATFQPSGSSTDLNFGLPSTNVSVSGTTEGQIQALACLRFGTQTGARLSVAVVDAGGHSSNIVSTQLNRPSGAPETPRGGGTNGSLDRLN
jgi:hypothetical protein